MVRRIAFCISSAIIALTAGCLKKQSLEAPLTIELEPCALHGAELPKCDDEVHGFKFGVGTDSCVCWNSQNTGWTWVKYP